MKLASTSLGGMPRARALIAFLALAAAFAAMFAAARFDRRSDSSPPKIDAPPGEFHFQEYGRAAGVDFAADPGPPTFFFPEIMGSGVAVVDVDGDGLQDLVFRGAVAGAPHPHARPGRSTALFRQISPGRFADVSAESGIDHEGYGAGVATGDVNNDGLPDLYLTNFGGDALYLNRGGGRFARVAAGGLDNRRWATSAAFFDFDRDGRLDLYVCNYCDYKPPVQCKLNNGRVDYCAPVGFAGTIHRLYRNETRPGAKDPSEIRFRDVTVAAGIAAKPGRGLGALPVDFDDDGWPDLYVANDAERNFAWRNLRNGGFEDAAAELNVAVDGVGRSQASMGLAEGDVDGDGRPDIVATSFRSEYTILYRAGKHAFEDASARYGLPASTRRYTGFGVALEDFDGDGNLDLVQANGMVTQPDAAAGALPPADPLKDPAGVAAFWRLYAEPMVFLKGDGRTFRESLTAAGELAKLHAVARGLAVGDLDGDARPDLVVVPSATPARLFHCAGNQAGRRLSLRLVDPNLGGRDALGAKVVACVGEYRRIATLRTASSYQSASEPTIRLGLGKRDGPVRIEVRWPSGDPTPEVFENVPADRPATLRRGEGRIK